ncbi:MAG: ABC transporter permease [Tannerella sp.]|jgi:putative ABC transport system permease protein|nr:ABC transporter permease [Tannerella sp.]
MFSFDSLRETGSTMKKNKLRTFLTGFSVAWGIFMLIILLAAGNGLRNGIASNFEKWSNNMVEIWPRYTTRPYSGLPVNRQIRFTREDVDALKRDFPEVDRISPINYRSDTLTFGHEYLTGRIRAVYPDFAFIQYLPIPAGKGRFINGLDLKERRKVVVLSPRMAEILFRDSIEPLGQHVRIGSLMFQVIGIYKDDNTNDTPPAYIPFSTGEMLFEGGYRGVGDIDFTVLGINTKAETEAFEKRLRARLARRHRFDPEDMNAIGMYNMGEEFRMWQGMNDGIAMFIWVIGIGTLMAGIVGVSNIMLITVRERTREFGIRKALGAKPSSILKLVVIESVLVTAVFGYVGMVLGIGLTEMINFVMEMAGVGSSGSGNPGENTTFFRNPTIDMGIAVSATCVLIAAGVLAGYFPARKAIKISAIEAMREE